MKKCLTENAISARKFCKAFGKSNEANLAVSSMLQLLPRQKREGQALLFTRRLLDASVKTRDVTCKFVSVADLTNLPSVTFSHKQNKRIPGFAFLASVDNAMTAQLRICLELESGIFGRQPGKLFNRVF